MITSQISTATVTATNDRPTGAMALLEKYATLNKCIERTRNQTTQAQSTLDTAQQSTHTLIEESNDMNKNIIEVESDIKILRRDLEKVVQKRSSMDRVYSECDQRHCSILRELDLVNQMKEDSRKDFLKKSKEFRTIFKSAKDSLLSLAPLPGENKRKGRPDKTIVAYLILSSDDDDNSDDNEDVCKDMLNATSIIKDTYCDTDINDSDKSETRQQRLDDETSSSTSTLSKSVALSWSSEDPRKKIICSETASFRQRRHKQHGSSSKVRANDNSSKWKAIDDEMNQARFNHIESTQVLEEAKRELEKVKSNRRLAIHRANDRRKKLSQQRLQLERVRLDAKEMEKEVEELENSTNEARQMGNAFAKDASRRRKSRNRQDSANAQRGTGRSQWPDQNRVSATHQNVQPQSETAASILHDDLTKSQRRYPITPSPHVPRYNVHIGGGGKFEFKNDQYHPSEVVNQKKKSNTRTTPNNPYIKKSNPYLKGDTSGIGHEQNEVPAQIFARPILERQHPHHAGRIRVDKRFSTAISITSEGQSPFNELDTRSSKLEISNNNSESSIDLACKQISGEKSASEYHISSPEAHTVRTLNESESDDDELLHFEPFHKNS